MAVFPEKVACGKLLSVFSYIYYKSQSYNKIVAFKYVIINNKINIKCQIIVRMQ